MPEQKLDLVQFPASRVAQPGAAATQIVGRDRCDPGSCRILPDDVLHHLLGMPVPQAPPALLTRRNTLPLVMFAASVHRSSTALAQSGMGTVRVWPALPCKSMIAQCSSRC